MFPRVPNTSNSDNVRQTTVNDKSVEIQIKSCMTTQIDQWGPFSNRFTGETNNSSASWDEDSAVMHTKATLGVCILDPTRTLSLIPAILQA